MKKSLKKVVFDLMDKGIEPTDQRVTTLFGDMPNFQTVENYKTQWHKKMYVLCVNKQVYDRTRIKRKKY